MLLFQSRGNSRPLSLSGNGTGIIGAIYAPAAAAGLSGNAQVTGTLVVSTLSVSGNAGAFQLADGADSNYTASTSNWISNEVLTVAVQDDTGNGIDPSELHQISEAMTYLNQSLGSFGVNLSWAAPGTNADVHIHFATTTPQGGAGDGVLGFTTASNDTYFVSGWQFYTGDDASHISPDQYDFLTLATHELGHTVGLGESSDPGSVMDEYLSPGTVRRTFTNSDLKAINTVADSFMNVSAGALNAGRLPETTGNDGNGLSSSSATVPRPASILGLAPDLSNTPAPAAPVFRPGRNLSVPNESPASPIVFSRSRPLALGRENLFAQMTARPWSKLPSAGVSPRVAAGHFTPGSASQEPLRIELAERDPSIGSTPTGRSVDEVFVGGDIESFIGASGTDNSARHQSALDDALVNLAFEGVWVDQVLSSMSAQPLTVPPDSSSEPGRLDSAACRRCP